MQILSLSTAWHQRAHAESESHSKSKIVHSMTIALFERQRPSSASGYSLVVPPGNKESARGLDVVLPEY